MSLMILDKAVTAFHSHNVDTSCFAPWCCLLWIILFCKFIQHIFPRLLNYLVGRVYLFILPRVRKLWIILLIDIHPHKWTHQFHIWGTKRCSTYGSSGDCSRAQLWFLCWCAFLRWWWWWWFIISHGGPVSLTICLELISLLLYCCWQYFHSGLS